MDKSPKRIGDIDKELSRFIEEYVDSFVKWDLITYFYYTADSNGSPTEISSRLGRKQDEVEEALKILSEKGLVEYNKERDIYTYTPTEELEKRAEQFCEALEDRDTRLDILAKLLRYRTKR